MGAPEDPRISALQGGEYVNPRPTASATAISGALASPRTQHVGQPSITPGGLSAPSP